MKLKDLKALIILEYLSGDISLRSLAAKYNYDHNIIYRWIMAHHKLKKTEQQDPVVGAFPELEIVSTNVAWLQEELRLSRIRILLLEATIDICDEQFGTSMRKKAGTRQS
jgi:transposase-like protein